MLRRRKAGENALLTGRFYCVSITFVPLDPFLALKSIIDHMEISEDNVKEFGKLDLFRSTDE